MVQLRFLSILTLGVSNFFGRRHLAPLAHRHENVSQINVFLGTGLSNLSFRSGIALIGRRRVIFGGGSLRLRGALSLCLFVLRDTGRVPVIIIVVVTVITLSVTSIAISTPASAGLPARTGLPLATLCPSITVSAT